MTEGLQAPASSLATATLLFVATFTIMVGSVITPALPAVSSHLGFPHSGGWLVTLPSLGVVLSGRAVGKGIDRIGARSIMLAGLVSYGLLGVCGSVLAFSRALVLADRLLLGVSTAMVMAAGTALIPQMYDGPERLTMIGRQAQAIELGGVVFLSIGGMLGSHGWRLPFGLYLLALAGVPMVLRSIPNLPSPRSPPVVVRMPTGLRRVLIAATLSMMFFFISFLTLPSLLAERLSFTESKTGYFLASISLVAVLVAGSLPWLLRLLPIRWLLTTGFVLFGTSLLLFSRSTTLVSFGCGAFASGCAFGICIPLVNHITVDRSPAQARGLSLGLLSSAIFLGQFVSSLVTIFPSHQQGVMLFAGLLSLCVALFFASSGIKPPSAETGQYT